MPPATTLYSPSSVSSFVIDLPFITAMFSYLPSILTGNLVEISNRFIPEALIDLLKFNLEKSNISHALTNPA